MNARSEVSHKNNDAALWSQVFDHEKFDRIRMQRNFYFLIVTNSVPVLVLYNIPNRLAGKKSSHLEMVHEVMAANKFKYVNGVDSGMKTFASISFCVRTLS